MPTETRYEQLKSEIAEFNKGKHYLQHDDVTFHAESLCAEIDALRTRAERAEKVATEKDAELAEEQRMMRKYSATVEAEREALRTRAERAEVLEQTASQMTEQSIRTVDRLTVESDALRTKLERAEAMYVELRETLENLADSAYRYSEGDDNKELIGRSQEAARALSKTSDSFANIVAVPRERLSQLEKALTRISNEAWPISDPLNVKGGTLRCLLDKIEEVRTVARAAIDQAASRSTPKSP
jgi:chromosome segregation ATPase